MLKRFNYCMILIIFIVNASEFAYFFFKSGESQEERQRQLVPPLSGVAPHWLLWL